MKRRRRQVETGSLSFLDCISCGFGAAVLLFMLVDHARIDRDLTSNFDLLTSVDALENKLLDERQDLLTMQAALSRDQNETENAEREAERLRQQIEVLRAAQPDAEDAATTRDERMKKLQDELLALESRVQAMRAAAKDASANATRTVSGEGQRQYLTGLRVGGRHILILVDASASMLDDTIVGALRRRNMSESARLSAPKWRRTLATVDWITAQMPPDGQFQMIVFNETAKPVTGSSTGWLPAQGGRGLDEPMRALRKTAPAGGTSLVRAFQAMNGLSPAPDNVYLITDGLPTQGQTPRGGVVSGRDRLKYFNEATSSLRRDVPINVILLPMEGDPRAASAFWQLARLSGGAFLEPSRDWP
ncbi:MAG: VWA domain-containing protein [Panacagrimonas sp.]